MLFRPVSWKELHTAVFSLSQKIEPLSLDSIVALSRGGLTIGHMFSDFLNLPVQVLGIASYRTFEQREKPEITTPLSQSYIQGKRLLLVDDVADSGKTLETAIHYLGKHGARQVVTATIFLKPTSRIVPDYWNFQEEKWIVFPFEVRETLDSLVMKAVQQGGTKKTIEKTARSLGFDESFIHYYLDTSL